MDKAAGATASKETYPVGRRESVKHWFFKGRQRPPANPPDTGQSRSDCPPSSPSRRFHHSLKKIPFSPILPPAQKKQRPRGAFMRLTGTLQNVVSKARRPLRRVRGPWRCTRRSFPVREKPQADSFSAAAGVFLPDPVDSISAKRSSSSRMRRSISAICCTMVRFFSLSRETMQVR